MAALSFKDWKEKQKGTPSEGTPSQAMATPSDTIPSTQPRLTFSEWKNSQSTEAQVNPEVTQEVASAQPQPTTAAQPQDPLMGTQGQEVERQFSDPTSRTGFLTAGLPQETLEGADVFREETLAPFVKEEGLPIAGGIAATAALPATASVGAAGWAITAAVGAVGSAAGEAVEQTLKKYGLMDMMPGQEAPETWGEVAKASIVQGAEDGAIGASMDALVRLTPKALRFPFTVGAALREDNKHMLQVLQERGGPIMVDDVAESTVINHTAAAVTNSMTQASRVRAATAQEQIDVLAEAAQEPLDRLITQAGVDTDAVDTYIDSSIKALPDEILAEYITTVVKDGERASKDVAGALYNALDEVARGGPTKRTSVTEMVDTGVVGPDGKPIQQPKVRSIETPVHTVNISKARQVVEDEIDLLAKDLAPKARQDYREFARSQMKLFDFNEEMTLGGAFRHIKQMSQDARALARSSEEGAATKRMWLLKTMDEFSAAMDMTAQQMADAGVLVNGKSAMEVKREADTLWREANETFGNRYISDMVAKADSIEGSSGALAGAFMKNRESSEAILRALDVAEKSADKTARIGLMENTTKARAAVSAKVYESMIAKVLLDNQGDKAMKMLSNPQFRKSMVNLMGVENLNLLDLSVRSLGEATAKGLNVSAFTQFARESAFINSPSITAQQTTGAITTLTLPHIFGKALQDPKKVQYLLEAGQASDFNKKMYLYSKLVAETSPMVWEEYDMLSEEEKEKRAYKAKLSQL